MQAFLAGAAVLAGALTILNLILTFGVIRRLREHAVLLEQTGPEADVMMAPGSAPEPFAAVTTAGEPLTRADLGEALVGFFSPSCAPCRELAPRFVERAAATAGGRTRVVAVVVGEQEAARDFARTFEPVARVVVEGDSREKGGVAHAFGVVGFPAVCTVDGSGVVSAAGWQLTAQGVPAAAAVS